MNQYTVLMRFEADNTIHVELRACSTGLYQVTVARLDSGREIARWDFAQPESALKYLAAKLA